MGDPWLASTTGYKDGWDWEDEHPTPEGDDAHVMMAEASRRNAELGDPPRYYLDFLAGAMDRYYKRVGMFTEDLPPETSLS